MRASECSVIKKLPEPINILAVEERDRLYQLGQVIATQEGLRFAGYVAITDTPYSVEQAKLTLFFN